MDLLLDCFILPPGRPLDHTGFVHGTWGHSNIIYHVIALLWKGRCNPSFVWEHRTRWSGHETETCLLDRKVMRKGRCNTGLSVEH